MRTTDPHAARVRFALADSDVTKSLHAALKGLMPLLEKRYGLEGAGPASVICRACIASAVAAAAGVVVVTHGSAVSIADTSELTKRLQDTIGEWMEERLGEG